MGRFHSTPVIFSPFTPNEYNYQEQQQVIYTDYMLETHRVFFEGCFAQEKEKNWGFTGFYSHNLTTKVTFKEYICPWAFFMHNNKVP